MRIMSEGKTVFTCGDCKDFYDCKHELEQNNIVCEYFVQRYTRELENRTIGDLLNKIDHIKQVRYLVSSEYFKNRIDL